MEKVEGLIPFVSLLFGKSATQDWKKKLIILLSLQSIMLLFEVLQVLTGNRLSECCGIQPRQFPAGLFGIFLAPFIHSDITLYLVNVLPLFILGMFVMLREDGIHSFVFLNVMEIIAGGLLVWAVGRAAIDHNGASGLIFSYFGYLVTFGFFRRDVRAAAVAFLVIVFYGGVIWGVLPTRGEVSWESNMFGFIVGCVFGAWEGENTTNLRDKAAASSDEKRGLTSDEQHAPTNDDRLHDADLDV